MKIIKSKKYAQMQEVSYQTIFDEALQSNSGNEEEAATAVLDAYTGGTWAGWDQTNIDKAIQIILGKFGNNPSPHTDPMKSSAPDTDYPELGDATMGAI